MAGIFGPRPRGTLGFPYGLLKRFPTPLGMRVDPCVIAPDGWTQVILSGGLDKTYKVIIIFAPNVLVFEGDLVPSIGTSNLWLKLTATEVLGKAAWDVGVYFVILVEKPNTTVGTTTFIVTAPPVSY